MTPNVIDISHHNTINDFAALKAAGVLGVIHKCTQGTGYVDPMYAKRRKLAVDAGMHWGAYAFNTGQDVDAQVKAFVSCAEPDDDTLMVLDFEDNPASNMTLSQAKRYLTAGEAALDRKLVLYSGNRVKDLLGSHIDLQLSQHRLWLAQYGPKPVAQHSWKSPWLWQYSEHGRLPGTDGNIDLNFYSGTAEQLAAEWSGSTPKASAPVVA